MAPSDALPFDTQDLTLGNFDTLAKELLRESYLATDALEARRRLVVFYNHCANSEVPELERLARTIARWEVPILRWHRTRLTNAATEGTNLIIKNIKRLATPPISTKPSWNATRPPPRS